MQLELDLSTAILTVEEWKTITEFPGYEVSSFGRFRNRFSKRYLAGTLNWTGYIHIGLTKNKKQVWKLAHRVVAETFLEKPTPQHFIVNHKNNSRPDNRVSNLEWATRSENSKHGWNSKKSRDRGVNGNEGVERGLPGLFLAKPGK